VGEGRDGRSQLITSGNSISAPGFQPEGRASAALACSRPCGAAPVRLSLAGIEPSRAKGSPDFGGHRTGSQRPAAQHLHSRQVGGTETPLAFALRQRLACAALQKLNTLAGRLYQRQWFALDLPRPNRRQVGVLRLPSSRSGRGGGIGGGATAQRVAQLSSQRQVQGRVPVGLANANGNRPTG